MVHALFIKFARIFFLSALAMACTLTLLSAQVHAQDSGGRSGIDRDNQQVTIEREKTPEEALRLWTTNLNEYAKSPNAPPFIGRQELIRMIILSLNTDGNNIKYLTGPAGSGKSAIVEQIARLLDGSVTIYRLEQVAFEAETGIKGTQRTRLAALIKAFKGHSDRILFIDEAHTIMKNPELMNDLKPLMSRGEISMILGTTDDEYREDVEKDQALTSRGSRTSLQTPTEAEIVTALRALKPKFQEWYQMPITDSALKMAARLTLRYYPYEPAYRKAFDIVRRAMAFEVANKKYGHWDHLKLIEQNETLEHEKKSLEDDLKLNLHNHQEIADRIEEIDAELSVLATQLNTAHDKDYKEGLSHRLSQLQKEANALEANGTDLQRLTLLRNILIPKVDSDLRALGWEPQGDQVITEDHIAKFVSVEKGIPVGNLRESDQQRAMRLEEFLNGRVSGQREAAKKIALSNKIGLSGFEENKGPRDVILLTGSSGVGKNEIVNSLALGIYNDLKKVVRIDMASMGAHSAMSLVGSGPGLVGSDRTTPLEPIRLDGYVIFNLDEMDKASRDMDNLLMAALDQGEMKDAMGRQINFRNTTVIITANWAEEYAINKKTWSLRQVEQHYGFAMGELDGLRQDEIDELVIDRAMERSGVSAALRNRIKTKILMNAITFDDAVKIARTKLADQAAWIEREQKVTIVFDDTVAPAIAKAAFDERFGARAVERGRRDAVSTLLAEIKFDDDVGGIQKGDVLKIKFVADEDGKGGMMIANRKGTTLRARQILFRSAMSQKADAGKEFGEAGKEHDMNDVFERTKAIIEKAKGHVK